MEFYVEFICIIDLFIKLFPSYSRNATSENGYCMERKRCARKRSERIAIPRLVEHGIRQLFPFLTHFFMYCSWSFKAGRYREANYNVNQI